MNKVIEDANKELDNYGRQLVKRGLDEEGRGIILSIINRKYCKKPLTEEEMEALNLNHIEYQRNKGLDCPYKLVLNNAGHGTHKTILMCFEKAGWDFLINDRGDHMECNMGTDEYIIKDPKVWRSLVIAHCQDNIMHSLSIKIQKTNGNYSGLKIDTPKFNFTAGNVDIALEGIKDTNTYDPFIRYLESEAVEKHAEEIRRKHIKDGKLDDTNFLHWRAVQKVIQFGKPKDMINEYFETDHALNQYLLYCLMFPAVFMAYHPGVKPTEAVVLIGPEGCFKSLLSEKLLPNHLQDEHANRLSINPKNPADMVRIIKSSIYAIFDEGVGLHTDEEFTKTLLDRKRDPHIKKFHENVKGYPRRAVSVIPTNKVNLLKLSDDAHRRYICFGFFPNQLLAEIGRQAGKTKLGLIDYLEEWADDNRDRLWAEMKVYCEMGRMPGLPFNMDEYRIKAVRLACGLDTFEDDVRETFLMFASEGRKACDYEDIFEQTPYEKNRARENIVKRIHRELGGSGELKRGWLTKTDDFGNEKKISRPHFDLTKIDRKKDDVIVDEVNLNSSF